MSSAAQSNASSPGHTADSEDSDEEFVYPGVSETAVLDPLTEAARSYHAKSTSPSVQEPLSSSISEDASQVHVPNVEPVPEVKPAKVHPSPAQLESLQAAASSGDLALLQKLFRTALHTGEVEPFALANDASPRTGLTVLHASASRGYVDIVKWRKSYVSCCLSMNLIHGI